MITNTPKPPYYAVIFSSVRTDVDEGYNETAERMEELAKQQEGFLGVESARNEVGVTVSYWESLEAILNWRNNAEHTLARTKGKEMWYKTYQLRICKVERAYDFEK
ncbi:antibiotic biosynthesis monooxygenase family protein [Lutibacter holmesii]|uniref:Antibiotic biosynthesis monooxygenase family protein n=1 Tax=Lutibacter holmesii TaxID=1137985 RepID=A0ABW3WLE4_9FLAO